MYARKLLLKLYDYRTLLGNSTVIDNGDEFAIRHLIYQKTYTFMHLIMYFVVSLAETCNFILIFSNGGTVVFASLLKNAFSAKVLMYPTGKFKYQLITESIFKSKTNPESLDEQMQFSKAKLIIL